MRRLYIDANSIGHAAQHGNARSGKLYAGDRETTAIFGMLRSANKLLRTRLSSTPIWLWDGRSHRFEEHPDYKGNRSDTADKVKAKEEYKSQRRDMFRGLHLLGQSQLVAANMEADDMAAILTRKALAAGDTVTLITADRDWLQLVEHGVAWFDPRTEKKCNVSNFEKFTGYRTQKAFIHSKALQGDAGDNIKPKTGVGEKGALDLLAAFDDVHEFLRTPLDQALNRFVAHHVEKPKTWAGLAKFHGNQEAHERFEFALKMMDLGHPEIPAPKNIRGTKAKVDRDGFVKFCSEFGFASILKDVDAFLSPFIQLEQEFSN